MRRRNFFHVGVSQAYGRVNPAGHGHLALSNRLRLGWLGLGPFRKLALIDMKAPRPDRRN
jgi:hypothetical protein